MKEIFFVRCPVCDDDHNVEDVEFLNIEEDIQGRDVMTFRCPISDTTQNSLVFKGYN